MNLQQRNCGDLCSARHLKRVKWHYAQANEILGGYFKVTQISISVSLTVLMPFLNILMARMKTPCAQASHAHTDTFMQAYSCMN